MTSPNHDNLAQPKEPLHGILKLFIMDFGDVANGVEWSFIDEAAAPDAFPGNDGVMTVNDGDHLVVYDKLPPHKVVWDGIVSLRQFQENDWAQYFLKEHPAQLQPAQDS